jgi:hypothetical protein
MSIAALAAGFCSTGIEHRRKTFSISAGCRPISDGANHSRTAWSTEATDSP